MDNFNFLNNKEETKQLLYSNATFDIKEVLSDRTGMNCCSVTVITPSQTVSYSFERYLSKSEHVEKTATILSRIYPNYKHLGDQRIFENENENNIFILTTIGLLAIFMTRERIINQWQYDELIRIFEEIKKSDYIKNNQIEDIIVEHEFLSIEEIEEADKIIKNFKSNITERSIPVQYPISKFDFSNCKTKEEIMKYAEIYSEELHRMMEERTILSNTSKEFKKHKNVTNLGIETFKKQQETYTKKQVEAEMEKQQDEIFFPPKEKEDEQTKE